MRPHQFFALLLLAPGAAAQLPLPTTAQDFVQPGTQPNTIHADIVKSTVCSACHGFFNPVEEPYQPWTASLMAQSARDPIFHACLAIAEQDASFIGETCLRCHTPGAWLAGRSTPTDGTGLIEALGDFDGVTCNLCHRMVDPISDPLNPAEDPSILAALAQVPTDPHTGQYVIDPEDRRRGPYDLGSFFFHEWRESPFHRESRLCATCHDVSNPAFTRSSTGSYDLNAVDTAHPTHAKSDEFPLERTFSEWAASEYAVRPVDTGGLFGGSQPIVSTCQDCHMPETGGYGCNPAIGGGFHGDLGQHHFNGANSWVIDSVRSLYPDSQTGLDDLAVAGAHARTDQMMQSAADLQAFHRAGDLIVRVVNETGHKLPTGYHEGRRMWIHVEFLDVSGGVLGEHGAYDSASATLTTANTTVFEAHHGLDANMAAVTGLPQAVSFHFALNNEVYKDNRIPPRGFTLDKFILAQAQPVGEFYPEHHYWHDTSYPLPAGTASARVQLYHQTTSREYIEFLRDTNTTNSAGQIAYDQWVLHGKSEPFLMDQTTLYTASGTCPPALPYGIGKTTSAGLEPRLMGLGAASVSAANFQLRVSDLPPNKPLLGFWSLQSNDYPLFGGTLFLKHPIQRMTVAFSNGNGDAWVPAPLPAASIGQERYYQVWFRDPQEPSSGVGLTNGLHVDVCP